MKWMIASDIHGSAYYCEKLLQTYRKECADRLLLLGDLLYHGPRNDLPKDYRPKAVIEMLNHVKHELLCVRGNCDSEVDQMVLDFPIMADYCILPFRKNVIFVTHGHVFHRDHLPALKKGDILLNGHFHVPAFEKLDGIIYMNPGSVSIPKEGSAHSYMIFEDDTFLWKDLEKADDNVYKRIVLSETEQEEI